MNSFALWTSLNRVNARRKIKCCSRYCGFCPNHLLIKHVKTLKCNGIHSPSTFAASADVHINLWTEYAKKDTPFLDIGIMINNPSQINQLYLFIPFIVETENLTDLGDILTDNQVLNAIFNKNFSVRTYPTSKHTEVFHSSDSSKKEFDLYSLDISRDITIIKKYDGTILTFSFNNISQGIKEDNHKCYIRFRITTENLTELTKPYKVDTIDKLVNNVFTITRIIDFRFNNNRSLDKSLLEEMYSGENQCLPLTSIHFLLLTEAKVDILQNNYASARDLEKHIWKKYLLDKEIGDIVAYHWKAKGSPVFYSWELFSKMRIKKCNMGTIGIYLLFLSIFTLFINLVSSYIWSVISK